MITLKEKTTETDLKEIMAKLELLIEGGNSDVPKSELEEIRRLANAPAEQRKNTYIIERPATLTGLIEMKMYELKLKQKDLAKKLGVSDVKLSLIMSGKQKPDVNFLKAIYRELKVDADALLSVL